MLRKSDYDHRIDFFHDRKELSSFLSAERFHARGDKSISESGDDRIEDEIDVWFDRRAREDWLVIAVFGQREVKNCHYFMHPLCVHDVRILLCIDK